MKQMLQGLGIAILGFLMIIWYLIKIISCILIASFISVKFGLTGYYWLASSVIIFALLVKILFIGNHQFSEYYSGLVNNFNDSVSELEDEL